MLPFSEEVFLSVFEVYNRAIWPAQVVAYLLGLAAVLLAFRRVPFGDRMIGAILALAWLWTGIAYHWMHFATVNFVAPAFAAVFVLQGLLLAWSGVLRGRLDFRFRPGLFGWTGLVFTVYAMALYPLSAWLAGHAWPQMAMFGVTPCPATIFTFGMLLLIKGRTPLHLLVIPLLWSLVGGTAVWLLRIPEDAALPLAGLGGFGLVLWKNRRYQTTVGT